MAYELKPLQDAFNAGRTLAPAAVGTQVLIMSVLSLATMLLFNLLRPRNKIVYEPKAKYHIGDKAPPRVSDRFCGWLPPLIHTKEPELLEKIGLDAVAFLRFLRLMRGIFAGVALLTCCVLIPINYRYNLAHVKLKRRDALSMLTIRDLKGSAIYGHVAISYLITILVLGLVFLHGRAMVKLRNQWFKSPEYMQSFYARTLAITNVPKRLQTDAGLNEIIGNASPYPVTSIHMARTVGELPQLIEFHNQTVRDFEAILVKYLKAGNTRARPVVTFGGIFGFGGVHKDAIEYYTHKLKQTEAAVETYRSRIVDRKPVNYGFVSLAAVPYAHIAARNLARKHPRGATVTLAPNPKDIIWSNMTKSKRSLSCKRLIGFGWLSVICFLSLIPLLLVAALANLDGVAAAGYLPFLQSWSGNSSFTFAIVSGVVPPAVSGIFTVFLPRIMRWLGKYQGAPTHARLDRAVVARYFAFLVISQLIVFTLIGVILNSVTELVDSIGRRASAKEILANLDKLPGRISKTYINTSTYWLKFFPLRGFLVIFDLAQILNLLWISFKTRVFGRTPRDIREWTQPPGFEYSIYYSNLLFMAAVGLIFAPLVPLVALAAAVVFWISSWIYKYQLMYVFTTKVETGGRLWNVVINRVLVCLLMMQCLMILTIGLQLSFRSVKMIIAIPPILGIIVFKLWMDRKFNKNFHYYLPDEDELRAAHVHSTRADTVKQKLQTRFGHPSLHAELFTPMVHAEQMQLLRQVYGGKIEEEGNEGKAREPNVQVLDGLRIAAIRQSDLQYDPVLYSRDRGEYAFDNDRFSLASTTMLSSSRVSQVNDYNRMSAPPLSYAPQSYARVDRDGALLSPQSILTPSFIDSQSRPSPTGHSAPPQGYFDPRLSPVPAHSGQHQPLPMHTRDSSMSPRPISAASQGPPGVRHSMHIQEPTVSAMPRPGPAHENSHHSLSVYSQDTPRTSSQLQGRYADQHHSGQRQSSHSRDSYLPPAQTTAAYAPPGQPHLRDSLPTFPQPYTSTGSGSLSPSSLNHQQPSAIEEVPRISPEHPPVVFQFGAPGPSFPDPRGPSPEQY
ncbi:DUF221-domain-containing protein [Mycena belliarum]|uniref:DUF221-domain-containing protein n=1 Tax=Mycena belliarum TaxID=1033014 RepID=A0AAD6XNG5_9AGAR|nr:DUF221-domain-containing protein [Mycena belliae]